MALITDWYNDIVPLVAGSSMGMKANAVRQACMEFCRETLLWTEVLKVNPGATKDFSVTADAAIDGWAAETVTAVGDYVKRLAAPDDTICFECTARAGDFKTGASEPVWDTTVGNTTVDDTNVTWTTRAHIGFDLTDLTDLAGAGVWLAAESAQIVAIQSVKYKMEASDGTELDDDQFSFLKPITKESWDRRRTGNWIYRESSSPSGFYVDANRVLFLYPIPTENSIKGLQVTAYLEPIRAAASVPDFLYENFYHQILDGAFAYLFRMKGQAWEDVPLSQHHRIRFLQQLSDSKHTKWKGRTTRSLGVTARRFV
jgi:hypothetical protein